MKKEVPEGVIIWYDSVTHEGNLHWQKALNENNFKFMQSCDGFFTDYKWTPDFHLPQTLETFEKHLTETHSSFDIFIGNDCYGRGTYGGGRFNIIEAVNCLSEKFPQFSIALFG